MPPTWRGEIEAEKLAADATRTLTANAEIVIFVVQLVAPALLLLVFLRPLLSDVGRERAAMFSVFTHIPHEVVTRLSKGSFATNVANSDDDSSDDDHVDAPAIAKPDATTAVAGVEPATEHSAIKLGGVTPVQTNRRKPSAGSSAPSRVGTGRNIRSPTRREPTAQRVSLGMVLLTRLVHWRHSSAVHPVDDAGRVAGLMLWHVVHNRIRHAIRYVRGLPPRLLAAMIMMLVCVTVYFVASFLLVYTATAFSASVAVAGVRSALVADIQYTAQELMVAAAATEFGSVELQSAAAMPWNLLAINKAVTSDGTVLERSNITGVQSYIARARTRLSSAAQALQRYHAALQYGDEKLGISDYQASVTIQRELLYSSGCLRTGSPCVGSGHPYSRLTSDGLHALVQYFADQAIELSNTTTRALAAELRAAGSSPAGLAACTTSSCIASGLRHPKYDFLWVMAENDLGAGMETSLAQYEQQCVAFIVAHTYVNAILFCTFLVLVAASYLAIVRPRIARIAAESMRAAALLRQLPVDLDLSKLRQHARLAAAAASHAQTSSTLEPAAASGPGLLTFAPDAPAVSTPMNVPAAASKLPGRSSLAGSRVNSRPGSVLGKLAEAQA